MSKLFEDAVAKARQLSEEEQDALAEALFSVMYKDQPQPRLTPAQVEDVKRIQREIRAGTMRFATDEELAALWKNCGL